MRHRKPYVLVVVDGGVADVSKNSGADIDILDLDNLRQTEPGKATLSDREWEWLKKEYPEEYARLGLAEFTYTEEKAWEFYFREGKNRKYGDDRAAHFAWRQMQTDPDFARLQNYHGAKP